MNWNFGMYGGNDGDSEIIRAPITMMTTSTGALASYNRKPTADELRARALASLKAWQTALEAEKSEQSALEDLVKKLSAEITDQKEKDRVDAAIRAEWLKLHAEAPKQP